MTTDNWTEIKAACEAALPADVVAFIARHQGTVHSESQLIAILHMVQATSGYLSKEQMNAVAQLAQIPLAVHDSPAKGTGKTLYRGTVTLDTTQTDAGYVLLDQTRGTRGAFGHNAVVDRKGATRLPSLFTSPDNIWGNGSLELPGTPFDTPTAQTVAADLAAGIQGAWDYYRTIHRRNGWDGQGTAILGQAHSP